MPLFLLKYGKYLLPILLVVSLLAGAKLALIHEYKKGYAAAITAVELEVHQRVAREIAAAVEADRAARTRETIIREHTRGLESQVPAVAATSCPDLGPDVLRLFNDAIAGPSAGPAQ